MNITYRKAQNNSWIQCFVCGLISHNRTDAAEKWCEKCQFHHTNGIVEESSRLGTDPGAASRDQKLIVALFLCLGKTMQHVPVAENIEVSEAEIAEAWNKKVSPVKLVARDEIWGSNNVFKVVREKQGFSRPIAPLQGNMPKRDDEKPERVPGRVFDFDLK